MNASTVRRNSSLLISSSAAETPASDFRREFGLFRRASVTLRGKYRRRSSPCRLSLSRFSDGNLISFLRASDAFFSSNFRELIFRHFSTCS
ncbi:hypothetical protein OROGR_004367 [Orobanche gracilis]